MAATITKGQTFGATELVTNTKLNNLVDSATITGIVNAEIASDASIVASKLDLTSPGIIGSGTPSAITCTTLTSGDVVIEDDTLSGVIDYNLIICDNEFISYENDAITFKEN